MTQSIPQTLPDSREAFEAWLRTKPEAIYWNTSDAMFAAYLGGSAALAAQPLVGVIPPGMALVPIEPTEAMEIFVHKQAWKNAIGVCTQPPAGQQDRGEAAWKCSRCGCSSVEACNGVGCFAGENSTPIADWQLIEAVPQSEERFLVISRSGRITIDTGHFMHNMMHAAKVDGDECFYTHWRVIPPPPSIGTAQGVDHG